MSNIYAFWHCFGVHAGESPEHILTRKHREITATGGWTLWSFSGKTFTTIEKWRSEIRKASPAHVFVLCSRSKNAVDPKGKPRLAKEFRVTEGSNWLAIPSAIKIPHPFGDRITASAFKVSKVLQESDIKLPDKYKWLCVGDNAWRDDNIPTRGEYLLRPGNGVPLRPICAILELRDPFVVEIK
jgi:hypothetical protein